MPEDKMSAPNIRRQNFSASIIVTVVKDGPIDDDEMMLAAALAELALNNATIYEPDYIKGTKILTRVHMHEPDRRSKNE